MIKQAILLSAMALAGCGASEHEDIKKWMTDATKGMQGKVEKIDEPKKFAPFKYEAEKSTDPFNTSKIAQISDEKKATAKGGGLKPDFDRPKEVLEAFPLENLRMVGMMKQKSLFFGIIKADTNLHRVKVGNYMGQSFGIITGITETEITLKELVQDGGGDWIERVSTLQLQEERK
jgi:type IV pilus assembly protein PilP